MEQFSATDDPRLVSAARAYLAAGRKMREAARNEGVAYATFYARVKAAQRLGMLPMSSNMVGFEPVEVVTDKRGDVMTLRQRPEPGPVFVPPPEYAMGMTTLNLDGEGRVKQSWPRWAPGAEQKLKLAEHLRHIFDDCVTPHHVVMPPAYADADFANLIPVNDWHLRLLIWARDAGSNWDLKIAEPIIGNAIVNVIKRARPAGLGIVLGGGDIFHADDNRNRTSRSDNILDCDGRHGKGIEVAERLMILTIDTALEHHDNVIVRFLPGNHDEDTTLLLARIMKAYYRNESRVTIDLDESLFWFHKFGNVMLAATHGHTVPVWDLPAVMAHREPEMWGETTLRYAHGFHVHHKSKYKQKLADVIGGVACETHDAPIPPDWWHYGQGYLSGRTVKVVTYHKRLGYFTENVEPLLDAGDEMRVAA